jgi:hypothetical protein
MAVCLSVTYTLDVKTEVRENIKSAVLGMVASLIVCDPTEFKVFTSVNNPLFALYELQLISDQTTGSLHAVIHCKFFRQN